MSKIYAVISFRIHTGVLGDSLAATQTHRTTSFLLLSPETGLPGVKDVLPLVSLWKGWIGDRKQSNFHTIRIYSGAGEMAQRLRALTVRPEVLSSNPSNHMVAYNHL